MCECKICLYIRDYKEAVEKNDKEFLMKHFDYFINVDFDLDMLKCEQERLIKFLKEKELFCEYQKYRNGGNKDG